MAIKIHKERCPSNHRCPAVKVCPEKALSQKSTECPAVDAKKCIDCNLCTETCPMGALVPSDG